MPKRYGLAALLLAMLCAHPAAAYGASSSPSPGDPPVGSPAGAVYQLPFEKGRADAAPKGGGGTSAGGEGGGSTKTTDGAEGSEPSLYRSENNFGSSSQVPGAPSGSTGANGGGAGGSGSAQPGGGSDQTQALGLAPGELTDSGNTSPAANIGLLVLIALIAGGVGYLARRSRKLTTRR